MSPRLAAMINDLKRKDKRIFPMTHDSASESLRTHAVENIRDTEFDETVATTPEEIRKLGKEGWVKCDEAVFNGVSMHFYRKPKTFGV